MSLEQNIQIIGYRKGLDKKSGKEYTYQKHFDHIKVSSILKLFENLDAIIELIPVGERYDIHYTCANCHEPTEDKTVPLRLFSYQEMIPIDLDHIDLTRKDEYIKIVGKALRIDLDKTLISCSGHGIHMVIALTQRIETGAELHKLQRYYTALAKQISLEFFNNGLCGEMDSVRLAESATLRLPKTQNRKIIDAPVDTYIINQTIEPQALYLESLIDIVEDEKTVKNLKNTDTKAVLGGCDFLKYCYDNPNSIKEYEWYAMTGILSYIPEVGINLCHTYSEKHKDYSFEETQTKAEQALGFGKPRTCASIHQIFPSCVSCPYYTKVKTPLSIKGEDFIQTEHQGFHDIIITKSGEKPVPNYGDLLKFFSREHTYVVNKTTRQVSIFNGKFWKAYEDMEIDSFATKHFNPTAVNTKRAEFKGLLFSTNQVDNKFFGKDNAGHVNFNNGVLRLLDRQLLAHSPDFGFSYVLPYAYNPHAKCPEFDKMMDNVTLNDKETQNLLLEYVGYSISGLRASFGAKALILTGRGSNGKSTFLNIIKMMIGDDCFSTVSLEDMNDANNRNSMVNKLFNICEEVEENELKRGTAIFKSIVTGANMMVKKLYSDTVSMRIDTKLILSCNELPSSKENTYAIYRRMLIVPFKAKFDKSSGIDKGIEDRVQNEMSGVYNRVLDAYDIFIKNNGNFSTSAASEKALAEYKYNNSVYNQFSDHCLAKGTLEDYLTVDELMVMYNSWSQLNNISYKPTSNKLMKELKTIGILPDESAYKRVGTGSKRVYLGVKKLNSGAF